MFVSKWLNKKIRTLLFVVILTSLFFCISAQEAQTRQRGDLLDVRITIEAEDVSLPNILKTMSDMTRFNFVVAMETTVEKDKYDEMKISVSLRDVPVEHALGLIVKSVGLSYRLVGDNTFLIGERRRIEEEVGERTFVIHLNYLDAARVVDALSIMPGEAVAIEGQNALLLRANPETYAEILKRISEIDIPQQQVEIRARLIEVSITDSKRLGIDWSRLNSLTTIIAEDPVNADGVGLPYNYSDVTGSLPHGSAIALGELPETQYFQRMQDWGDVGKFSRQLTAFDITIDWLLENNAAKLLTDTRITALNGEDAEIHIGEVVPFVVTDREYRSQVEREEVGIMMKVTPTINKDGQITTRFNPEVSSVVELVGGFVPRTKVRRVESTVTVPNGSKIIVGGLLHSQILTHTNKIPFLGDLPWIGKFFQHLDERVSNTDLIIELTPRIITPEDFDQEWDIDQRLERRLIRDKDE